jgi:ABC-type branched-subunit amino acid transport system ATPase component
VSGDLIVSAVSKHFGGVCALAEVSLAVPAGAIVAVIGANGAGKTTLFDLIGGFERPDGGSIGFDGQDITGWPPHLAASAGIGRSFRPARPFGGLSVEDNLVVAALGPRPEVAAARQRARLVLEGLELAALGSRPAAGLDRNQRMWLELARVLAARPRLLLLDELLADLEPAALDRMIETLRGLNRRRGLTLVLAEHGLHAVAALADRVVVLDHGAVIAEGTPDEVAAAPAAIEAGLGLDLP